MTTEMERDRRIAMQRLADSLDIPVELLGTDAPGIGATYEMPMGYGVGIVTALGILIEQYRTTQRLREDAPLVVSLGRDVILILEQRGRLLGGDGGVKRYVMVGETKVEVEEDSFRQTSSRDVKASGGGGAKVQAPSTGPRPKPFKKRGKQ
jgi:hypothetical protein